MVDKHSQHDANIEVLRFPLLFPILQDVIPSNLEFARLFGSEYPLRQYQRRLSLRLSFDTGFWLLILGVFGCFGKVSGLNSDVPAGITNRSLYLDRKRLMVLSSAL